VRARTLSARLLRITGTLAARTKPALSALASELLGQNVSGLEIRRQQNVRITSDLGANTLCSSRFFADGVVKRQRSIQDDPLDLPAIGHLAKRGSIDGGRHLRSTVSTAAPPELLLWVFRDQVRSPIDGVLANVHFVFQGGSDVRISICFLHGHVKQWKPSHIPTNSQQLYPEFLPYGKNSGYKNRRVGLAGIKGRNGMGLKAERERGCRRGQKEISQLKKNPIEGEYPVVAARQQEAAVRTCVANAQEFYQ
jgi:hypothetical protein